MRKWILFVSLVAVFLLIAPRQEKRYAPGTVTGDFKIQGTLTTPHRVIRLTPGGATLPNTAFAAVNKKTGTNKTILLGDFDDGSGTALETLEWEVPVGPTAPSSVTFIVTWFTDSCVDSKAVVWDIVQDGVANDEPWDAAGTTVTGTGTVPASCTNTDKLETMITGTVSEFGASESVHIKLTRDTDDGADTLVGDARVLYVEVRFE